MQPGLPSAYAAAYLAKNFRAETSPTWSIFLRILYFFRSSLLVQQGLAWVKLAGALSTTIMIKTILVYLEDPQRQTNTGLFLAIGLFVAILAADLGDFWCRSYGWSSSQLSQ